MGNSTGKVPPPLTDRDRRIVEHALNVIGRDTSVDGEVLANVQQIRAMAARLKAPALRDLLGRVVGRAELPASYYELRKRATDAERDLKYAIKARDLLQGRFDELCEELEAVRSNSFGRANIARATRADAHARRVLREIGRIRARARRDLSNQEIALELTRRGVRTARGGREWTRMQVHRVLNRGV